MHQVGLIPVLEGKEWTDFSPDHNAFARPSKRQMISPLLRYGSLPAITNGTQDSRLPEQPVSSQSATTTPDEALTSTVQVESNSSPSLISSSVPSSSPSPILSPIARSSPSSIASSTWSLSPSQSQNLTSDGIPLSLPTVVNQTESSGGTISSTQSQTPRGKGDSRSNLQGSRQLNSSQNQLSSDQRGFDEALPNITKSAPNITNSAPPPAAALYDLDSLMRSQSMNSSNGWNASHNSNRTIGNQFFSHPIQDNRTNSSGYGQFYVNDQQSSLDISSSASTASPQQQLQQVNFNLVNTDELASLGALDLYNSILTSTNAAVTASEGAQIPVNSNTPPADTPAQPSNPPSIISSQGRPGGSAAPSPVTSLVVGNVPSAHASKGSITNFNADNQSPPASSAPQQTPHGQLKPGGASTEGADLGGSNSGAANSGGSSSGGSTSGGSNSGGSYSGGASPGGSNSGDASPGESNPGGSKPGSMNPGDSNNGNSVVPVLAQPGPYTLSIASLASAYVLNGDTVTPTNPASNPVVTVGGQAVVPEPDNQFVVNGQTLTPGGAGIQVSNVPLRVAPGGGELVYGGKTLPAAAPHLPAVTAPPALTFGTKTYKPNNEGAYVIAGQTLTPGGKGITVSKTPVRILLPSSGIVVGASTVHFTSPSADYPPSLIINSQTVTPNKAGAYVLAGQTLVPGGKAITVSNTPISLDGQGSKAVIGTSTQILKPSAGAQLPIIVGGQKIPPDDQNNYIMNDQTLKPGGSPITVSGTPVSLGIGASTAVVGTKIQDLRPDSVAHIPITVGGQTVNPNNEGAYVINGQTLGPGSGAITVSGTPISFASHGSVAVIGTSSQRLEPTTAARLPITVSDNTYYADGKGDYTLDGQTLSPGGPKITVHNTPISLGTGGTVAVVGSQTQFLDVPSPSPLPITFEGHAFSADNLGNYVIEGKTLSPGSASITVHGTPISLDSQGSAAVVGSQTQLLQIPTIPPHAITLEGQTLTADRQGVYTIDGQTLAPGSSAITVHGTRVSLDSAGSSAVIGSSTQYLKSPSDHTSLPVLTLAGTTYTANSKGLYIISGQTITPGGAAVVINPKPTIPSSFLTSLIASPGASPLLTVAGQTVTPNPTGFAIGNQTLTPGGHRITVSGTPISLGPSGTLRIGNETVLLPSASLTSTNRSYVSPSVTMPPPTTGTVTTPAPPTSIHSNAATKGMESAMRGVWLAMGLQAFVLTTVSFLEEMRVLSSLVGMMTTTLVPLAAMRRRLHGRHGIGVT